MKLNTSFNKCCLAGIEDLKKNSITPNLIICDAPYKFNCSGGGNIGKKKIYSDLKDNNLDDFDFNKYIPSIVDLQKDKVNAYFFCNKALLPNYLNLAVERGLNFDVLTMNKKTPMPCKNSSYLPELEYVVFLRSAGVYWDSTLSYEYYFKSHFVYMRNNTLHPAQKPTSIIEKFIKLSSKKGDLIVDFFAGSFTVSFVAKNNNRNYLGYEINKKFFDIGVNRLKNTDVGINKWIVDPEQTKSLVGGLQNV